MTAVMNHPTTSSVQPASELEIVITRVLHAPVDRVWRAWTEPKKIEQWFGPRGFSTRVNEQNFRVGGNWSYTMIGPDGNEYPCHGLFREIVPNQRIVSTDEFEENYEYAGHDSHDLPQGMVVTTLFEPLDDKTTRVVIRILHRNAEDKQKHAKMGVIEGWNSTIDCFDEHLIQTGVCPSGVCPSNRLIIVRSFPAPIEKVWRTWTRQEDAKSWHFPKDFKSTSFACDNKAGGSWKMSMRSPDGQDYAAHGTIRELDPPHRLVMTHVWDKHDAAGHETTITITLSEHDGRTTMIFDQAFFQTTESRDDHNGGWNEAFDNLFVFLTGINPGCPDASK